MSLLVTTALETTWGCAEPILFLGDWCKLFERAQVWTQRDHSVVRYHWDDRAKLQNDHDYLMALRDEFLDELASALGSIHQLDRSRRFWQILLDPWLSRYLAVIFDRWETLRVAFDCYEITRSIVIDGAPLRAVRGQTEFVSAVSGDSWNHSVFSDILNFEYSSRCVIERCEASTNWDAATLAPPNLNRRRDWKWEIASWVDQAVGSLVRRNDFAFIHPYFPLTAFLRLNLRLRQIPAFFLRDFRSTDVLSSEIDATARALRAKIDFERPLIDGFECFLRRRIIADLPQVYLELFSQIGRRAAAVKARPKVIFTANDHAINDIFKRWVAEKVHEKVPFVVMEHGSGVPPLFSAMRFEEEIADVKTTWTVPHHAKQVRLPANKLAGRRRNSGTGTALLVVGQEMPRYAFDALTMPIAGQTLVGYDIICDLHDALESAPQDSFLVKPYPNLGWHTRDRFIDRFGASKVSAEPSLDRLMKRARIVVCTYPQTTLSEAMTCGAPAMLLYAKHLWETVPQFDGLLETLAEARIVFTDPAVAADHINAIWRDPISWWKSPEVQRARLRYEEEALDMRSDWEEPWVLFAKSLLSGDWRARLAKPGAPMR